MRCVTIAIIAFLSFGMLTACTEGGRTPHSGITGVAIINGVPAAGAEVNVYEVPERVGPPPVGTATTGGDGSFSIPVVPGTYYVVARLKRAGASPCLSKLPPDPVVVDGGFADAGVLEMAPESGEALPPPHTGLEGTVVMDGNPVAGAVVYVYAGKDDGLKGPAHAAFSRSGMDGAFRLDVSPGTYYVVARKRFDASASGELSPGDLSGEYAYNPVKVSEGNYADIGRLSVGTIDLRRLEDLRVGISESEGGAFIRGRVEDDGGRPLHGVHVFAYTDYRMMGKPRYKSASTGEDGEYTLVFDGPGRYYIGARDSVGGPLEPGDMVGVYEGSEDNSVEISAGETLDGIDITLREVQ